MKEDRVMMPQYLLAPFSFLWFESDDLVPLFASFGLGVVLDHPGYGAIAGIAAAAAFSKQKAKNPQGFLKHLLYARGFLDRAKMMRGIPKSWEKDYIG